MSIYNFLNQSQAFCCTIEFPWGNWQISEKIPEAICDETTQNTTLDKLSHSQSKAEIRYRNSAEIHCWIEQKAEAFFFHSSKCNILDSLKEYLWCFSTCHFQVQEEFYKG